MAPGADGPRCPGTRAVPGRRLVGAHRFRARSADRARHPHHRGLLRQRQHGARAHARPAGRRPGRPRHVSVIGFDDIPDAEFFGPALTTVRQDFDELGRRALVALIRSIDGAPGAAPKPAARPVAAIDPSLVVRASTARPAF